MSPRERAIDDQIELVQDAYGLAVIGDAPAVDRFLDERGLVATSDLPLPALGRVLSAGSAAADAASQVAASSGRCC